MTEINRDVPGLEADKPSDIPPKGWWQISKRIFSQVGEDHIQIVSAGVAFYAFLAMFPALSAIISFYGLMMSPEEVQNQISQFATILPEQGSAMLGTFMQSMAAKNSSTLSTSLIFSLILSLWSANRGTTALFEGLNIVYNEPDKRNFIKKKALTLLFTLAGFIGTGICLLLIVGISAVVGNLNLPAWIEILLQLSRWPILAVIFIIALALLYKYSPCRNDPEFRWVSTGSVIATLLWLTLSFLFAQYVDNFSTYDQTYGSLAAVIIMLLWLFLSSVLILLGAEINAEMEHQTRKDTTVGPDKPVGERDAYYADHYPPDDQLADDQD